MKRQKTINARNSSTEWQQLDQLGGGLKPGHLIILAARPGTGLTSPALSIVIRLQSTPTKHLVYFSLGESDHAFHSRLRSEDLWASPEGSTFHFECSRDETFRTIEEKCVEYFRLGKGPGLIIVDYLQLLLKDPELDSEARFLALHGLGRSFERLAKKLQVTVLLLTRLQPGDGQARHPRPDLSDLRLEGGLDCAADQVLLLHRDGSHDTGIKGSLLTEVIVARNRAGSTGSFLMCFLEELDRFEPTLS